MEGRVAIVTGVASGLGRATATALSRKGVRVVLADRNFEGVKALGEVLASSGGEVLPLRVDVSQEEDVTGMVAGTLQTFGQVDILINNAGVGSFVSVEAMTKAEWDRVFDINLWGVFVCSRAVLAPMKERRYGRIINLSSVAGKMGGIFVGANYSASKAGVTCLTKTFAKLLAPYDVTVNAIAPGAIETPFHAATTEEQRGVIVRGTPLGRFGEAEDIAEAIIFLASEEAKYITGEILDVNGGMLMD